MAGRFPSGLRMTTIQATRTSDGTLFDHPIDAAAHQVQLDLADYLDKAVNGSPDRKAIIEFVQANRDKLRDILNGEDKDSRV